MYVSMLWYGVNAGRCDKSVSGSYADDAQTPDCLFGDEKEGSVCLPAAAGTVSGLEVQPGASVRSPWKLQSGPRLA